MSGIQNAGAPVNYIQLPVSYEKEAEKDIQPFIISGKRVDDRHEIAPERTGFMAEAFSFMQQYMMLFAGFSADLLEKLKSKVDISSTASDHANRVEHILAELDGLEDKKSLSPATMQFLRDNKVLIEDKTIDEFLADRSERAAHAQTLREKIKQSGEEGMQAQEWGEVLDFMGEEGILVNGEKACDFVWHRPEVGEKTLQNVSRESMQEILQVLADVEVPLNKGDLNAVKSALESTSSRASETVTQANLQLQQYFSNHGIGVSQLSQFIKSMSDQAQGIISKT